MINKKILSLIIVVVVISAGIGTYEVLSSKGFVNPGITINSFTSSSNTMMNDSGDMPTFTAHVDSSKTAEYQVISGGNVLLSGTETGDQTISFPSPSISANSVCSALSHVGLHHITFKVLSNSFHISKTINVYTFPCVSFNAQHSSIDTGISDKITACTSVDNLTMYALGVSHTGKSFSFTPSSPGIVYVNFSMSSGSYHFSHEAGSVKVFNPPQALPLQSSDIVVTSTSSSFTTFNITMHSSGGDTANAYGLTYLVYVNGSEAGFITSTTSHSVSCSVDAFGSGPFNVYFGVKDNYYSATSNTIKVNS